MSTEDSVYQGRVHLVQPEQGFRAGTDSLLLAAALACRPGGEALEIGCGCGGALLPAAFRMPEIRLTGVEMVSATVILARRGVTQNGFDGRVDVAEGEASAWVRDHENRFDLVFANPPYFDGMSATPEPVEDINGANILALLGDSITTDHISPAGAIKHDGPAGKYLSDNNVPKAEFNSFGSRRGNHEVMMRGTFANIRIKRLKIIITLCDSCLCIYKPLI